MTKVIKIRKGLNIKLQGEADKSLITRIVPEHYALKPTDFIGITPKLSVNIGDHVQVGSRVFHNKYNEQIIFTSPVSGKITGIKRGEKRVIEEIIIKADTQQNFLNFNPANPTKLSREEIIEKLLKSGVWPCIRQRPYSTIANPNNRPKAIFISAFDTNPLAPDNDFILHGKGEIFQTGLDALIRLTDGKVHLNVNCELGISKVLTHSKGVQINQFYGPHPAGNVGVQIHHIDPINKGDIVWYLYPQDVLTIGQLFLEGKYDASCIIALTGSEVLNPKYYKILRGACIKSIVENNVTNGHLRYISGNVLSGKKIQKDGFVGFYDSQITIIPEGDHYEFLGWAKPGLNKFSFSRTFLSTLNPWKKYNLNTNIHGGERAFVSTGIYEKVLPMDILPMQLLKAIIIEDIDLMENLGIYEVDEEDFALCEVVCPSKIEIQSIIRKGLDLARKEMS